MAVVNDFIYEYTRLINNLKAINGGKGSGNFGHKGRKGHVGGSSKTNLKGQAAIKEMIKNQKGIIKRVFYRKDIGHIDLIWGDGSKGLSHILKRRGKDEKQDIDEFISDLTDVIEKGIKSPELNEKGVVGNRWCGEIFNGEI